METRSTVNSTIERHGIESIPDCDRTASILDFMRIDPLLSATIGKAPEFDS
jgi:hypothetical protein